jgi:hypothetical protein
MSYRAYRNGQQWKALALFGTLLSGFVYLYFLIPQPDSLYQYFLYTITEVNPIILVIVLMGSPIFTAISLILLLALVETIIERAAIWGIISREEQDR